LTSFTAALASIRDRIDAFDGAPWCAIEGEWQSRARSTVVEILGRGGSWKVLRRGAISEAEIQACLERRQRQAGCIPSGGQAP
jgi:tRNA A37 threonylcarbamoyladenosine synthetase subunit TsaC/SUA5/YrdC